MSIPGVPPLEPAPAGPAEEEREEFQFVTLPPEITFLRRDVPPPGAAYVPRDTQLAVLTWNGQAGVSMQVHMELLMPNGEVQQMLHSFVPTADRAFNYWTRPLPECFVLAAVVVPLGNPKPGACYVQVTLLGYGAIEILQRQGLVSGYVVGGSILAYPNARYIGPAEGPGRIRLIEGTDPAPGVQISEIVPNGARWRVISTFCWLYTSTAVGNRSVYLYYTSPGGVWLWIPAAVLQPPSNTYYYSWSVGLQNYTPAITGVYALPLPADLYLTAGQQFIITAAGLEASDNFGPPRYLVEEWIEP